MSKIQVLDHGYVDFVEAWGRGKAGSDISAEEAKMSHQIVSADCEVGIIEAARQSTQGSFRGWDQDAKLLSYLYDHKHETPFEFAGMVIEVQAPIFVFREWHRHRTQSYNEMSARYVPLPDLYYYPDAQVTKNRAALQTANKQAQGSKVAAPEQVDDWLSGLHEAYGAVEAYYKYGLGIGIPKELARLVMPVGHYSRMRASANLRNWLAFMTLRCDPAAQWEIRQYSNAVASLIQTTFPRTHSMWCENPRP